mmetsp:Transcript_18415/g.46255  ORF Transcript_18415/g.46255 Transcript_18415/m.46255 type:complete len:231 (-) Transcript_18415:160-852(-)
MQRQKSGRKIDKSRHFEGFLWHDCRLSSSPLLISCLATRLHTGITAVSLEYQPAYKRGIHLVWLSHFMKDLECIEPLIIIRDQPSRHVKSPKWLHFAQKCYTHAGIQKIHAIFVVREYAGVARPSTSIEIGIFVIHAVAHMKIYVDVIQPHAISGSITRSEGLKPFFFSFLPHVVCVDELRYESDVVERREAAKGEASDRSRAHRCCGGEHAHSAPTRYGWEGGKMKRER